MNPGDKGAWGELMASAWLIKYGYEVFRNVSPVGDADLIAWYPDDDEVILIDVTTSAGSGNGKLKTKPTHVRVLVVEPTGECHWLRERTSRPTLVS